MEVFKYPAEIDKTLIRETKRRLIFWLVFLSPFVLFCAHNFLAKGLNEDTWISIFCLAFATFIIAFFEYGFRIFNRLTIELSSQKIEFDGVWLKQFANNSACLRQINLTEAFVVWYSFAVCGNAVYKVAAKNNKKEYLEFSTRIENCERLVVDILKQGKYPPGID